VISIIVMSTPQSSSVIAFSDRMFTSKKKLDTET